MVIVRSKFDRNRTIRGRVIDDFAHLRRSILGGGALSPDCSHGCVDRTSSNLLWTQSDHRRIKSLFQNRDTLLRFKTWTAQNQVVSKLEVEFCTKWGDVGNLGFEGR